MNGLIQRLLYRALPLSVVIGVLVLLRWSDVGVAATGPRSTTIGIGFLLIALLYLWRLGALDWT